MAELLVFRPDEMLQNFWGFIQTNTRCKSKNDVYCWVDFLSNSSIYVSEIRKYLGLNEIYNVLIILL